MSAAVRRFHAIDSRDGPRAPREPQTTGISMRLSVKEVRFYMRNVRTRMPFKYGAATLTSVPILHALMEVELEDGRRSMGAAADILPPKWFDKDPNKGYEENVEDLIFAARAGARAYGEAGRRPGMVFDIWEDGYAETLKVGDGRGLNHLTAGHGSTLMERCLIDGLGMGLGKSYHEMLRENLLGLEFGRIYAELKGVAPSEVIDVAPLEEIFVRHTVGLADPIWTAEIGEGERLDDGLPQSLEEYAEAQGLTYFKIKVNGDLEGDLERLRAIAGLLDQKVGAYSVTLDGNEQYGEMDSFLELLARMAEEEVLAHFFASILYIEQPLERSIALSAELADGIRAASVQRPMLVDESDGDLRVFGEAVALGYRGVSSKNCKGLIKALANRALARRLGEGYFLSGEDLMNLPVVALHQDLVHLAALGVGHAERNGHHYVRGLDHLSAWERDGCRERHGSLYRGLGDSLALDVRRGKIDISSLQGDGLGVGGVVDVEGMVPLDEWKFESLA
jgi:hypothetical protein